jgi:hypothetical protein
VLGVPAGPGADPIPSGVTGLLATCAAGWRLPLETFCMPCARASPTPRTTASEDAASIPTKARAIHRHQTKRRRHVGHGPLRLKASIPFTALIITAREQSLAVLDSPTRLRATLLYIYRFFGATLTCRKPTHEHLALSPALALFHGAGADAYNVVASFALSMMCLMCGLGSHHV